MGKLVQTVMDWLDIFIHTGIAIAGVVILSLLGVPVLVLLIVNTIVWPAREAWQHRPDYHEIITRPQSFMEWVSPVILGGSLAIWFEGVF